MSSKLSDTHPAIEQEWREQNQSLSAAERWKRIGELNRTLRTLALSDLKHQHPHESVEQLRIRLAHRLYGHDLASKAFGPLPDEQN